MVKERPTWRWKKPWTKEEDEILVKHYRDKNIRELLPNRTWTGIKIRASVLGIRTQNHKRNLNMEYGDRRALAATIDGEGCIGFNDSNAKDRKKSYLAPFLKVINTNRDLIDWVYEKLGDDIDGGIYKKYDDREEKNQKTCWEVTIGGPSSIQAVLELVFPYLIVKKKQAELMMKYTSSRVDKGRREKYTVDPRPIAKQIRKLNKRGLR